MIGAIGHRDILEREREREREGDKKKHTQLRVLFNGLLLSNLEALGLGGSEIILVVGHCGGWCSRWGYIVILLMYAGLISAPAREKGEVQCCWYED